VSAVLPWIVAYAAILLLWALIILQRRGPTLWKGRSLVALNIAFVLVSTAVVLLRGQSLGAGLILFDIVLVAVALVVRDKWLLLGISRADSAAVLEKCFTQTRSSSTRRDDGYVINCGGAEMSVTIRPSISQLLGVSFTGGTGSRKAELVQKLFCKQFHSSFPTPRFRA
jgi:hypothetical protein